MIVIGSARHDENGKLTGGAAGDQTQKGSNDFSGEVSMQDMYNHSKGWYILRPKSITHAANLAKCMQIYCNDANVGYDQSNRTAIMSYDVFAKSKKTECDCSALVRRCIKDATGVDVGNFTTANEATTLEKSGLFEAKKAYSSQSKTPVYDGDVLVTKTKGHTVIVVSGNPRQAVKPVKTVVYYPACKQSHTSITAALASVGEKDTSMTHRKKIAAANGVKDYAGLYIQNVNLLALLKNGKLVKA